MQSQLQIDADAEAHRLATRIAQLERGKRAVLLRRLAEQGTEAAALPIVPFRREARMPVSHAQRGLWLTWKLAPRSAAYNMAGALVLEGSVDPRVLGAAVDDLARRHEALRTVFHAAADGEPEQEVLLPQTGILQIEDLSSSSPADRRTLAKQRTQRHAEQPFDLETGPLWRALLLRLDDRTHWLSIVVHHIAADGWSVRLLIEDLIALYEAHATGNAPALPSLPIQFADYAMWQREWTAAGELDRQLDYWKHRLGAEQPILPLPLDRPRTTGRHDVGIQHCFSLPRQVAAGIRQLAETNGSSVFMVMLALLKIVLARHCGVNDIRIGIPVANRGRAETHRLIGYLTNVLVVRTQVDLRAGFRTLLATVREGVLDAQSNADCPFDLLVSTLVKDRQAGVNPLFQVKCTEQQGAVGLRDFCGIAVSAEPAGATHAHFDLSLDFTVLADEIACDFSYPSNIFNEATVTRVATAFVGLAQRAAMAPDKPLVDLLPTEDLSRAVGEQMRCDAEDDVVACWERSVASSPHALALRDEERVVTRAQLDAMANALAARLIEHAVGCEVRVGIHASRSIEFVEGVLAVLKAGGVCVPLDPALPPERLAYQTRDSGIALLLSVGEVTWQSEVPVLPMSSIDAAESPSIYPGPPHQPDGSSARERVIGAGAWKSPSPLQAAYIIYTSGSTGHPKGVVVGRGALANYVRGVLARLDLPESSVSMAMVSTVAADLGHTVLFGALCAGKLLHLISAERVFDPDRCADYLRSHRIDVLKIVPSHLQGLLNAESPLDVLPKQVLVLGGEATHWKLLDRIQALSPSLRVINHYGPTETTVGVLTQEEGRATRDAATLPMGSPLPNSSAYVFDGELQVVPMGTAGELYVGGAGVTRGYQGRAAQTADRFVANPCGGGERLYRTGDRVRQLPGGGCEFLGRVDDQVKIRGYRVELGEIAQALLAQPEVNQAIVVTASDQDGRTSLYGYVTLDAPEQIDGLTLCERLREVLPDYMVPNAIIVLESPPKNANGKIDRRALPEPRISVDPAYEAPRDATEQVLAAIWAEVLEVARVGRHDNFFALGGDSILSLKMLAAARKRGLVFDPRGVFRHQKLCELAASLDAEAPAAAIVIPALDRTQRVKSQPLSYAQARQWFLWQLDKESTAYHVSGALKLKGELRTDALKASFDALVARHESLRTVFRLRADGQGEQLIAEQARAHLEEIDLSAVDLPASEHQIRVVAARLHQTPFDLEKGPLLRIGLIRAAAGEHLLVAVMHHIVSDGWSMQLLIDEFVTLYSANVQGEKAILPSLPIQYVDYAVWQSAWLAAGEQQRQLAYWRSRLGDDQPILQLPIDYPRPAKPRYRMTRHSFELPVSLVTGLRERAKAHRATLFVVLLAGFQALLHRYTGHRDIRVGTTDANRHRPETHAVVGFFVNTLVLRSEIDGDIALSALIDQVRGSVTGAQEHRDLPFERLVEALQPERDGSRQPLFQILMDHQRKAFGRLNELPGLTLEDYELGEQGALFDLWMNTIEQAAGGVTSTWSYAAELFAEETIRRLGRRYVKVLEAIAERPTLQVGEVELLDAEEQLLLQRWGGEVRHYPAAEPIQYWIERQARQRPDATALILGETQLSYSELNRRANRLAHRLIGSGVQPESRVGIAMERSIELIVGLLATLKAGGAYVPLDPQYPAERLSYMMKDSGIGWLLAQASVVARLPRTDGIVSLHVDALDLDSEAEHDPRVPVHADQLAYVIYTSGSTGRPKGAQICHRQVSRLLAATNEWFHFNDRDVWTLFHSCAFDFSVWEIFGALCHGGTLVIVPYAVSRSPEEFFALLREQRVTVLNQTPSAFKHLMQVPGLYECGDLALRLVIFGGEALEPQSLRRWIEHFGDLRPRLVNMYGITETTVHVTYRPITNNDLQAPRSPIGERIPDLGMHVLDASLNPAPVGVPGELYVAGDGLARGYLNRSGLSSERFIANPFSNDGTRLYRTGDLVRWSVQGQLEYLGRIDAQVKIRGFRIELGEIESQLLAQPEVREAVVVVQGELEHKRLLAYVVPQTSVSGNSDANVPSRQALVTQWESVFDNTYASVGTAPSFRGWNSSYTDQPIAALEMREWLLSTVDRIRELQPKRILEIGSGVGLLVQQLAPAASVYVGTDLSARAVNDLQAWVKTQPALAHVQLRQAEATDFTDITLGDFDTVVLNSVAQYLPDIGYLADVLAGAARALGPRGSLFIGDVRHLAHVPMFHASVQLHKASSQTTVRQLKSRIARAVSQDQELVLDPAFFYALATHLQMGGVEILLKRGSFDNELTRYRYDVVMRRETVEGPSPNSFDSSGSDVLERLAACLAAERPPALKLYEVANRRLARDLATWDLLQSCEERTTVGELLFRLERFELSGVDPEALAALADSHGYHARISWTGGRADGAFDVEFIERSQLIVGEFSRAPAESPADWHQFASNPTRALFLQQLGPRLRECLLRTLPDYMVPAHFTVLDALPLNANGKLDRKALPEPEHVDTSNYQAPQGPTETTLAKIWTEVLGVERAGRHDNFFELGGHSLMAVRIVSEIRRRFNRELSLRSVFERPTLSAHASLLEQQSVGASSMPILRAAGAGVERPPLSYAQQRLWFLWLLDPHSASMNSSAVLRLTGQLDLDAWQFAHRCLLERHAVLRTVFEEENGQVWQRVLSDAVVPDVTVVDLSRVTDEQEARLRQLVVDEIGKPFDLAHGPLVRAHLFALAEDSHVMCVVMHHIVTDGWSINVMIRDFVAAYAAKHRGDTPDLPALSLQYTDFAIGQREWLEQGAMQRQLDYWKERLTGRVPLVMPPDKLPPARRSYPCGMLRMSLDRETTTALRTLSESSAATPFMVLLTGVCLALAERAGQYRFIVGTDFANRNHGETEALAGFFVNQVALPIDCVAPQSLRELLEQVKDTVVNAADRQDLPFDRLVEALRDGRRANARAPLFQVKVLYQEEAAASLNLPGLQIADYPVQPAEVELDLILRFSADADAIHLTIKYDRELFEARTLECMGQEVVSVLRSMRPNVGLNTLRAEAANARRAFEAQEAQRRIEQLARSRAKLRSRPALISR